MSTIESPSSSPHESPLRFQSLCEAFQASAAAHPDRPALRLPDGSGELSWADYAARVRAIAEGLASLGVGPGDTVAMQLKNRPEFHLVDTATLHLGATPFSVYNTNPADLTCHLLDNSDAKVFVTEEAFLPVVLEAVKLGGQVEHVVTIDGSGGDLSLAELEAKGAPDGFDFEASWRAVKGDDFVTLVYTSGTTGLPKGVQHTHHGLLFGLDSMNILAPFGAEPRIVSYLPCAHIADRYISHYAQIAFGATVTAVPDPPTELPAALAGARPTRFFAVPRILEKLRGAILGGIDQLEDEPREKTLAALQASIEVVQAEQRGETVPAEKKEAVAGADAAIFSKFREKIGLDQAEWVSVAAAPTPLEVLEFFHAIGLPVAELWGMSECVLSTSNPPHKVKLGSVGYHLPNVEVRLAEDGEILVRGPQVTPAYRKDPERTKEALRDGWLYTGDVAREDEDGYLWIIDRKKELMINAAGKNMSPAHIEMTIKGESPLIAQVVAIGEGRAYVTALIVLDPETAGPFAAKHGVEGTDAAALAAAPAIQDEITAAVERGNARLARVEQLKKWTIVPETWIPGGDELTPTMKLKRKPIAEKYSAEIEALYA